MTRTPRPRRHTRRSIATIRARLAGTLVALACIVCLATLVAPTPERAVVC